MNHTVFFVAGKSGGHILPALTLAQQIISQNPSVILGIFSTDALLDKKLIRPQSYIHHHIELPLGNISKNRLLKYPHLFLQLARSLYTSLRILHRYKPTHIVSTGGLTSVPVCLGARLLGIPFDIHELNVQPGAAVKFLAPAARTVFICFEKTQQLLPGNVILAPYPLRFNHATHNSADARTKLGLSSSYKTLFIIGGSQGSRALNEHVKLFVQQLSTQERNSLQIIHQTGAQDVKSMHAFYQEQNVVALVFDYREDVATCYHAAHYVITRAGAGVLHELLFFKKRALIIPLESITTSHQIDNAQAFVEQNPCMWKMARQQELMQNSKLFHTTVLENLR